MIKSCISSFFLINPSTTFPLVFLVVFVLSIFLLLDKTSSQPKSRSVSSSIIPNFNEDIIAPLLINIDTLFLLMLHFLRTLLCTLPPTLPILMSYLYPFFILSRISHLYLRLLHLDHCRFILVAHVLTQGLRPTPLLWCPPPQCRSYRLPLIFSLRFGKVLVSSRNPYPIYNFLTYHCLSSPYSAFISTLSSISLPKTVHEAHSHPGWKHAMVEEMVALYSNGT